MYKSIPAGIQKIMLDTQLYGLHKTGQEADDFGMNNTSGLLEGGFGLYSTVNVKKSIGPIKTNYFRISLTRSGTAGFDIGLEKYHPRRNSILFGIPGQIFSLHNISEDFLAYYMLFSEEFISDAFFKLNNKAKYPFLTHSGLQCFELDEGTAQEIERIIFKINEEVKQNKPERAEVIRLFIRLILIYAARNYGDVVLSKQGSSNTLQLLFDRYLKLVSQHFLTVRKVGDYANMLHISPDYLNRAIKSCSGKTANELIDEMILMEAKAYLLHTEMSVSEIAYQLEFADPSHFSRFFKKLTGHTPLDFRN